MADEDPIETVQRILDSGRRVRFGRGVVSKTAYVAFGVVTVWAIVVWRLSDDPLTNAFLFAAAVLATAFGIWFVRGTQNYAEKNPAQAMLEGAELLQWQKMGLKAKGSRAIQPSTLTGGSVLPRQIEKKS